MWQEGELNAWTFTQSLLSEHHIERFALSLLRRRCGQEDQLLFQGRGINHISKGVQKLLEEKDEAEVTCCHIQ